MFDEFYNLYPRHESKGAARKSYERTIKAKIVLHEKIMSGLRVYLEHLDASKTERRFIKLPSTWLNQECWDDEYGPTYRQKMAAIPEAQGERQSRADNLRWRIADMERKEQRFGYSLAPEKQALQAQIDGLEGGGA